MKLCVLLFLASSLGFGHDVTGTTTCYDYEANWFIIHWCGGGGYPLSVTWSCVTESPSIMIQTASVDVTQTHNPGTYLYICLYSCPWFSLYICLYIWVHIFLSDSPLLYQFQAFTLTQIWLPWQQTSLGQIQVSPSPFNILTVNEQTGERSKVRCMFCVFQLQQIIQEGFSTLVSFTHNSHLKKNSPIPATCPDSQGSSHSQVYSMLFIYT